VTTVDDAAPGPNESAPHTVFYNAGAVLSAPDTGSRATRSSGPGTSSSTAATVRTRASGEIAASGSGSSKTPGKASAASTVHPVTRRARTWTVQVASYETFDEALAMQASLCSRGYAARILGAVRPYSVRVGHYARSDSALAVARKLTTRTLTVFVTPTE
jgi:cell division protein FtsN